jgi:hypothetical protein
MSLCKKERRRTNERQDTFIRAVAGAGKAPARRRSMPTSKIVKTTRKRVVVRGSAKGNDNRLNERQETFVRAVVDANNAPTCRHPPLASKIVETTIELVVR